MDESGARIGSSRALLVRRPNCGERANCRHCAADRCSNLRPPSAAPLACCCWAAARSLAATSARAAASSSLMLLVRRSVGRSVGLAWLFSLGASARPAFFPRAGVFKFCGGGVQAGKPNLRSFIVAALLCCTNGIPPLLKAVLHCRGVSADCLQVAEQEQAAIFGQ